MAKAAEEVQRSGKPVSRFGVDPVSDEKDLEAPFCPHGPTIQFRRYYADKIPREFYACAVYRDRKGCSFFLWCDDKLTTEKRDRWKRLYEEEQKKYSVVPDVETMRSLPSLRRHYCADCGLLVSQTDLASHSDHTVRSHITDSQFQQPSDILNPVDNRKSQAQFFFSDSSVDLLHSELKRLKFSRVLCVGTPRLHEVLLSDVTVTSLLLDIDHRFASFFSAGGYQRYNMFNHFFYAPGGREICEAFLKLSPSATAIVVDPPFGGLAEILARSLKQLWQMAGAELVTFLVFPYYMESHVTAALPSLWMLDYQVRYRNHPHFGVGGKKGKPSPVRIFTSFPRPGLQLPFQEGYWYCQDCNRYSAQCNAHCGKCGSCTSKDGRPYVHCDLCSKCRKKGFEHCFSCGSCQPVQHTCGTRSGVGCHVCGSDEHKRRDCPDLKALLPPSKKSRKNKAETVARKKTSKPKKGRQK